MQMHRKKISGTRHLTQIRALKMVVVGGEVGRRKSERIKKIYIDMSALNM